VHFGRLLRRVTSSLAYFSFFIVSEFGSTRYKLHLPKSTNSDTNKNEELAIDEVTQNSNRPKRTYDFLGVFWLSITIF